MEILVVLMVITLMKELKAKDKVFRKIQLSSWIKTIIFHVKNHQKTPSQMQATIWGMSIY
jgi:hypothetical protein